MSRKCKSIESCVCDPPCKFNNNVSESELNGGLVICKECGGDPVIADIARRMGHRPDIAYAHARRLEDMLFKLGAMNDAPCFCCGYNGPGYFQPDTHKCAERHHKLFNNS